MPHCNHQTLTLLSPQGVKLRCRHCHLTIEEKELEDGCCPECQEAEGVKRSDFERLEPEDYGVVRYSCEKCGVIIMI